MTTASGSDILRFRLASQLIVPPASGGPADVVQHFLAMQAQDFAQALWAIGARVPGSTRETVLAALDRGEIVRSWPMRGTLHWVAPKDLGWMLRLTTPRLLSSIAARHRQLELDQPTFDRARDVAIAELAGGRRLSRADFLLRLEAAGIRTTGQRAPHLIGYLAQTGVVVHGPPDGAQQALVLLDEWVPDAHRHSEDESLREFVLRYVNGHGPATLRDFVWWSKVTVSQARAGFELARDELVEVVYEGTSHWMSPRTADAASARRPSGMRALPGFDEWVLGYQNRAVALPSEHAERIVPGGNGVFLPTIVSAGVVVGTWRRKIEKDRVTVTAVPFEALTARQQSGFAREAARFGRFLGLPTRVV